MILFLAFILLLVSVLLSAMPSLRGRTGWARNAALWIGVGVVGVWVAHFSLRALDLTWLTPAIQEERWFRADAPGELANMVTLDARMVVRRDTHVFSTTRGEERMVSLDTTARDVRKKDADLHMHEPAGDGHSGATDAPAGDAARVLAEWTRALRQSNGAAPQWSTSVRREDLPVHASDAWMLWGDPAAEGMVLCGVTGAGVIAMWVMARRAAR
ncbi:MAG: hypothetical protein U0636_00270 [Phycisphaerales bacterium]